MKPSISNLAAGGTNAVEITVQSAHVASLTAASIARDKFLVAAIVVHSDSLSYDEIADLTKVTYNEDIINILSLMTLDRDFMQNVQGWAKEWSLGWVNPAS